MSLVSDFGQSEMRSEAYRLTGTPPPRTSTYTATSSTIQIFIYLFCFFRWNTSLASSGEDGGHHNRLIQDMDIYAFAICCIEIFDEGIMPWQHHDDFAIVRLVTGAYCLSISLFFPTGLRFQRRTDDPLCPTLTHLIRACWERDPSSKPSFKYIASGLK